MNKRPILVAFSNQKGGVGKSTVTAVLASYFNYVRGLKVAVVDCDYPQFSLEKLRGRDLKKPSIDVQLRTSEHRSMYSYVRLSIDRCTATYV